jgi:hypothetical protein
MKIMSTSIIFISGMIMSAYARDQSYEVDANGCISYDRGNTDNNCKNASGLGLFNGNSYSHSYKCTKGLGYACCDSTIYNQSNVQDLGQCVRNTTPAPTSQPTRRQPEKPTPQRQPLYEVDANGCVAYNDGNTDNNCKNASNLGFFNGNIQSNSYQCTGGSSGDRYACCASTTEYQSNVQGLGQCTRNYQEDEQGCIPARGFNSDESCTHNNGFTGHHYSYTCSMGETHACCNSNTEKQLSNVQNLGQCVRNTTSDRRNLRQRI